MDVCELCGNASPIATSASANVCATHRASALVSVLFGPGHLLSHHWFDCREATRCVWKSVSTRWHDKCLPGRACNATVLLLLPLLYWMHGPPSLMMSMRCVGICNFSSWENFFFFFISTGLTECVRSAADQSLAHMGWWQASHKWRVAKLSVMMWWSRRNNGFIEKSFYGAGADGRHI